MVYIPGLEMGPMQCEIIWMPVLLLGGAVNVLTGNKCNVQLIQQANKVFLPSSSSFSEEEATLVRPAFVFKAVPWAIW